MVKLSQGKVLGMTVPLPSLAEQMRIVAKVDELVALCGTLDTKLSGTELLTPHSPWLPPRPLQAMAS